MPKTRFLKLPIHAAILEVTFTGNAQGNGLIGAVGGRQISDRLPVKRNEGVKIKGIFRIPTPPTFAGASKLEQIPGRDPCLGIMVFRLPG